MFSFRLQFLFKIDFFALRLVNYRLLEARSKRLYIQSWGFDTYATYLGKRCPGLPEQRIGYHLCDWICVCETWSDKDRLF